MRISALQLVFLMLIINLPQKCLKEFETFQNATLEAQLDLHKTTICKEQS
jgi:hypothetical protein